MTEIRVNYYPKIHCYLKRNDQGELCNEPAMSEFIDIEYWSLWKKYNGTPVIITYHPRDGETPHRISISGRTSATILIKEIIQKAEELYNIENISKEFPNHSSTVKFFTEGIGPKIQGGVESKEDYNLVLFDMQINGIWQSHGNVKKTSEALGVPSAREVTYGKYDEFDYSNLIRHLNTYAADGEGLIYRPIKNVLLNAHGERIMFKFTHKHVKEMRKSGWVQAERYF